MAKHVAQKTKIVFKFLKPMGLALTHYGNKFPFKTVIYEEREGAFGRFPKDGYDFNEPFELELLDELPKPLPDVFGDFPPEVRQQYLLRQAQQAADNHAANNLTRTELAEYAAKGYIVVVEDSFMDAQPKKKAEPKKEIKKEPTE